MKRLHSLTPSDLEQVAVWHYVGENDDVATVRATARDALTEHHGETFLARTQFHLANGVQHIGFVSPAGDETALDVIQPVIVTPDGPVFFHFEEPPSQETLDVQWRRLGARRDQIFPVHFRCTVPVNGAYVTGVIQADDLTGAA